MGRPEDRLPLPAPSPPFPNWTKLVASCGCAKQFASDMGWTIIEFFFGPSCIKMDKKLSCLGIYHRTPLGALPQIHIIGSCSTGRLPWSDPSPFGKSWIHRCIRLLESSVWILKPVVFTEFTGFVHIPTCRQEEEEEGGKGDGGGCRGRHGWPGGWCRTLDISHSVCRRVCGLKWQCQQCTGWNDGSLYRPSGELLVADWLLPDGQRWYVIVEGVVFISNSNADSEASA